MATVLLAPPLDDGDGTYATNADGTPVPFYVSGYVDVPGASVQLYEDTTNALLGSTSASSSPETDPGPYFGWYPWSVWVGSWSAGAGAVVPAASVTATGADIRLAGVLAVPYAAATTEGGGISIALTTILPVYAATAYTAAGGILIAAPPLDVPAATATTSAGDVSISSGSTPASVSDNFNRSDGGLGAGWSTISGTPVIASNQMSGGAARRTETFNDNQYALVTVTAWASDNSGRTGVRVRQASGAATCYYASLNTWDDGEGGSGQEVRLGRLAAGTDYNWSNVGSAWVSAGTFAVSLPDTTHSHIELTANGTSIVVRTSPDGSTWTTRFSITDSNVASGYPAADATSGSLDDFAASDV